MSAPTRVAKAFAYITRGDELLVFTHRDCPLVEAGVQVPAGTVRDDEDPQAAAVREAVEETGLQSLTLVRYVGSTEYDVRPGRDEVHDGTSSTSSGPMTRPTHGSGTRNTTASKSPPRSSSSGFH